MNSERECFVYIVLPGTTDFVTAGRFRVSRDRAGVPVGAFVYRRAYRERPDAVEIDPVELRLSSRTYETARMGGFFGAIRDSMPDFWGQRLIERNAGLAQLDDFDYLMQGPDDRAGALGFGLNVEPHAPLRRFSRTLDLERLQAAADAIVADRPGPVGSAGAQVEELLLLGTSMGGARPKAVVRDDHELWIAKFSRADDRWNHPRVEHGLLRLLQACGLNAADSRIETIGARDVLLVRRFDRDWAETGYRRHRMVSALTLLRAGDDAGERGAWSYLALADEIRRVSADPEADLRELFGRICFNAAVSNLYDHPRNHALVARGRDWRLSPAFDLAPSPVVALERRDLAMACGRFGRYANRANLLSEHGRFLLARDQAIALFEGIVGTVREQWHPTLRRAGVSDADCELIRSAFVYDGLFYDAAG
jgi:serine/threonine-protein kinase HipA